LELVAQQVQRIEAVVAAAQVMATQVAVAVQVLLSFAMLAPNEAQAVQ
jgi:hypothetical protein